MAGSPVVLDCPVAWVCETYEQDGKTESRVIREGMARDDFVAAFPPYRTGELGFNRHELVKAIIYEAWREVVEGGTRRERDNIRGFWYERLQHTLIRVMGEPGDAANVNSINTTINNAWKELVEGGWVTYRALNLYSQKEDGYHVAVAPDSPYPGAVVFVEKESLFGELHDLADTYEISFVAAGGQNSRAAAMSYVADLAAMGVDLSQPFTVFSFCDFDPEGWDIPAAFVNHLKLKVGDVNLVRLGILREQLGDTVLEYQASPYPLEAKTERGRKGKLTKYQRFADETGGLYIRDARGDLVPARVELNIYTPTQIRERILASLAVHLDGFEYQIRALKTAIPEQYNQACESLAEQIRDRVGEAYQDYYDAIDGERAGIDQARDGRAVDERRRLAELRAEIDELEQAIDAATADLDAQNAALEKLRDDVEGLERGAANWLVDGILHSGNLPRPDEIVNGIESNGGWRSWARDVGLAIVDGRALTDAARQHRRFAYYPDEHEVDNIRGWLLERLQDAAPDVDDLEVDGPVETPDELVARALAAVDG